MQIYLNRIDGWDDAILTMFYSKRTVDRQFEKRVREVVSKYTNHDPSNGPIGAISVQDQQKQDPDFLEFIGWLSKLFKWCPFHTTMGRFLDLSFTVYGMHRAGQDDIDSHAKRMNNRIIRSSTRLADFSSGEMSDYYDGKIIPTDVALAMLHMYMPEELEWEGNTYVRAVNGYILKGMENSKDVKRGLYMLSIPSNFIFRIDLTEYAHIYKERNESGTANPEVKLAVETMTDLLENASYEFISRPLLVKIKN